MAEKFFPFPSVSGDRKYTADDWAQYFAPVITNGVFPAGTQLLVTADAGMNVSLSAGQANINGYRYRNTGALSMTLDAADGVLHRKDRIILRWDKTNRQITAKVAKGTPASSPVAPALVRSTDYYDLGLAVVTVSAGITGILSAHISDTRLDPTVCGIVSSLITPDTAGWYEGWEAEFNAWLESVKGLMDGDPGTNFAAAIAELQGDVGVLEGASAPITTAGTAPNFTITPSPAISSYADGQQWTIVFGADASDPTLNVSGKGAAAILEATGKAAKVKAGQIVRVMRYGASFFTLSAGGGIALPDTIVEGDTIILHTYAKFSTASTTYVSAGRGFTASKAGTYRFTYNVNGASSGSAGSGYIRLTKNGAAVSGSEYTNPDWRIQGYKTIDIALAAGDVLVVQLKRDANYATSAFTDYFAVSIASTDIQTALNTLGAINAG